MHIDRKQLLIERTMSLTANKTCQVKFHLNRELYLLFKEACRRKGRTASSIIEQFILHTLIEEKLI